MSGTALIKILSKILRVERPDLGIVRPCVGKSQPQVPFVVELTVASIVNQNSVLEVLVLQKNTQLLLNVYKLRIVYCFNCIKSTHRPVF